MYHYIIPQQVQNIPGLHTLVSLPQYNDIDFDSCKCQQSEENCAKEIEFHTSLQEQKEEFCTEDKILCCQLKENAHWDKIISKDNEKHGNGPNERVSVEETEEIEDLKVFVNEFFNELSISKEIESNNCRCRDPKDECGKQIHIPQSLQSQLISICPHPYIICCDIEDEPNIKIGKIHAVYENNNTDINTDKHTNLSSKKEDNIKLGENGLLFDNLLSQSLENLTEEVKERNETIFSNLLLETLDNLENINIGSDVSTEENLHIEDIFSDSNNSVDLNGIKDILLDIAETPNTDSNNGMNEDNIGSTDSTNIEQIPNKYDSGSQANNKYLDNDEDNKSFNDINLIRNTNNDKIIFKPETLVENFNYNHNEEYTLFDMMDDMGMFNATLDELKEQIKTLSRYEKFENLNLKNIEHDIMNAYNDKQDGDLCSGDDCIQNFQEENKTISNIPKLNSTGEETESKTNFSDSIFFNIYDVEDDFGFLLPMSEQDYFNSTSVTLYSSDYSKSKSIKDHIFYYSYLSAFLYVVGFLTDFLIPVFSFGGLAILQFFIIAFPKIVQSQIFDVISPLLKFIYVAFGLL